MKTLIYATIPAGHDPRTREPITTRAEILTNEKEYYADHKGKTIFPCFNGTSHYTATRADMRNIEPVFIFEEGEKSDDLKTPAALAHRGIYNHHLDASRVLSALMILATPGAIKDEGSYLVIQSDPTRPRYTVTPKSCPCYDSANGKNICKHRIAAWMYIEQHAPLKVIYQRRFCILCGLEHWLKDGETCEGSDTNPATIPGLKVIKTQTGSQARHAEIILEKV